jgi:DNA-binding transcriptional MocR family regulator
VDALTQSRITLDLGAPVLEQLVLLHLLQGDMGRLLDEHRSRLREQRDALVTALATRLPDWEFRVPAGGMVLWCRLPGGSSVALAEEAARHDVHLAPGPAFAPAGGLDRWVRLPFTRPVAELEEAARRLATAWDRVAGAPGPQRRTAAGPVMVA